MVQPVSDDEWRRFYLEEQVSIHENDVRQTREIISLECLWVTSKGE